MLAASPQPRKDGVLAEVVSVIYVFSFLFILILEEKIEMIQCEEDLVSWVI